MNLRLLTPSEVVLEQEVIHVTAEDVTGSLGIRPGHTPLVAPLTSGIVTARAPGGREVYVAIDGGVMLVNNDLVQIVSRQAVASRDLAHLEQNVLAQFEKQADDDKTNRVAFEKMRLSLMRHVLEFERAGERL